MSLTAEYETEIRIPQPQLQAAQGNIRGLPSMGIMRLAMEKVAKERGGQLADDYQDCNGKRHPCIMALRAPGFPNGVGVDVALDGRVLFRYDQQGESLAEAKTICDDLARAYATIAVLQAQKKLGYQVHLREEPAAQGRSVVISAIKT